MGHSLIDTYGMPSDHALKGRDGACRYVSHDLAKTVTRGEVQHIHALGKNVVLNFEDSATGAKGGRPAGVADAEFSVRDLRTLGAPAGVAVYASVDYEVHSGLALANALDYAQGWTDTLHAAGYLAGLYGDYDLIVRALSIVDFGWQTAAWSFHKRDTKAVLYQDEFTQSFDVDELQSTYYGAWTPEGAQTMEVTLSAASVEAIATAVVTKKIKIWNGSEPNVASILSDLHHVAHEDLTADQKK